MRPGRRAYENQILRVVANDGADGVGVAFDRAPVAAVSVNRFVEDFVDDVRHVFVLFGNRFEKCLCEGCFLVGAVAMPVDNDVDIALDGGRNHVVDQIETVIRGTFVRTFTCQLVCCASVAIVVLDAECETEYINFEVFGGPGDNVLVVVGFPCAIGPKQAYSAEHHLLIVLFADNLVSTGVESSVIRYGADAFGSAVDCCRECGGSDKHRQT